MTSEYSAWGSHGIGPVVGVSIGSAMSAWGYMQGSINPDTLMPWVVGIGGLALAATNFAIIIANRLEAGRVQRHLIRVQAQVDEARILAGLPREDPGLSRSDTTWSNRPTGHSVSGDVVGSRKPIGADGSDNSTPGPARDQRSRDQAQQPADPGPQQSWTGTQERYSEDQKGHGQAEEKHQES